jgi:hypothetical protein
MSGECDPRTNWRYYRCNGRRLLGQPSCPGKADAARIEQTIWTAVERALNNPTLIAAELERRQQGTHAQQDTLSRERRSFEGQIAQCDKELHKWTEMFLHDVIDIGALKDKKAEILTRRASAERELTRLDEQARLLEQAELETASLTAYGQRVRQALTTFDEAEKRNALNALQITTVWRPGKPIEITGSIPVRLP